MVGSPGTPDHGSGHGEMWTDARGNMEAGLIKFRSGPSGGVWSAGFEWPPCIPLSIFMPL